jgi:hypothetical protein
MDIVDYLEFTNHKTWSFELQQWVDNYYNENVQVDYSYLTVLDDIYCPSLEKNYITTPMPNLGRIIFKEL